MNLNINILLVNIYRALIFQIKMFRWANIDQMSMFISNLQVMILKKHAGKKIPQRDHYDITFSSDPGFVPPPSKTGWLVVNKNKVLIRHHFINQSTYIMNKYLR